MPASPAGIARLDLGCTSEPGPRTLERLRAAAQHRSMAASPSRAATAAVAAAAGSLALQWLGRTCGSTAAERRAHMSGDEVVSRPQIVATHAVTIAAPPDAVWPWLTQVGWHRGGWYTPRWVDVLLFPDNWPSTQRILDPRQALHVGDFIPDGAPRTECGFVVREVAPRERLLLESSTHLPLSWRRKGLAHLHWTWSFLFMPVEDGRATRLVFRWRARSGPWWLTAGAHLFIVPADVIMSSAMLRGLRQRAVGSAAASRRAARQLPGRRGQPARVDRRPRTSRHPGCAVPEAEPIIT